MILESKKIWITFLLLIAMSATAFAADLPVTSPFGWRNDPYTGAWKFHAGVDLGYEYGAGIPVLFGGQIVQTGDFGDGYGQQVLVYHADMDAYTRYAHCSAIYVVVNQIVTAGDIIAAVGSSGRSTGPHLQLEYIIKAADGGYEYTDPLQLWQ